MLQHRIITAEFQMKEQWRRCWITIRRRSSRGVIVSSTLLLFLLITILVGGCFSYWILLQRTVSIDPDDIVGRGGDDQRGSKQIKPSQKSIVEFLEWSDSSACRMIHGLGGAMRRWGMINQKSVCFDDSVKPRQDRCLIYSFSFHDDDNNNRDDWLLLEKQFSLYGCQVHLFDPKGNNTSRTINNNIHWHNWALSGSRQDRVGGEGAWEMRTMESIYESLSPIHGNMIIDYVKLDLEYAEWSVLPQMLESGILDRIRQLNVELHLPSLSELEEFQRWTKMIESLEDYGLVRFDSRPNSGCIRWIESLNQTTYCGYDLAWYNKKLQRAVSTQRPLDW